MLPQWHDQDNHRVGVIVPLTGYDDDRWIQFAARKLATWFRRAGLDLGVLMLEDEERLIPTALIYSTVETLSDFTLSRVYGLGMQVEARSGRHGVAVVVDDDMFIF